MGGGCLSGLAKGKPVVDAIDAALSAVPEKRYVLQPDGRPLPQTSNPAVITAMLRLLDVPPGARVLEIGTGSGYSTALLSHLAGPSGSVTSLDIDSSVVERARQLLSGHGVSNATIVAADGRNGYSLTAPFDRIIAWATTDQVPQAWVSQVIIGGLIVAPVQLAPLAHAIAVARLRRQAEQRVVGEQIIPGSFVPLTSVAVSEWGQAPDQADVIFESDRDTPAWISTEWLRYGNAEAKAIRLRHLWHSPMTQNSPLDSGEYINSLFAYLLTSLPDGLTTAFLPPIGRAIGCSNSESTALLLLRNGLLAEAGDGSATRELIRWIEDWRAHRRPGFEQIKPIVKRTERGWTVRAMLN